MNRVRTSRWLGRGHLTWAAVLLAGTLARGDEPDSPLSPEAALAAFVVDEGLTVELVASEPAVVDPVAMAFDERGWLWVAEMRDYPHGPREGEPGRSRIRVLRDSQGDGQWDTATTFAEGLTFITGLQPWRGGVIVTLAGTVQWMADTTGDGQADTVEVWYAGFAEQNSQLRANAPTLGIDQRLYIAGGLRGGEVRGVAPGWQPTEEAISLRQRDLRIDLRTRAAEAVVGNSQFGLAFDAFGNRFVCDNRHPGRHVVFETSTLHRNPHGTPPAAVHDVSPGGEGSHVNPLSRAWTTSNLHAGQFTAACGVWIYEGHALPAAYRGNLLTCEPTGSLVQRAIVQPQGGTFVGHRAAGENEFLASPDEWFRPVFLTEGPDGCLYVVDMYRAVIEHPEWMPRELRERPDLTWGDDRGRIWRIRPAQADATATPELPRRDEPKQLVALLAHPNAWQRRTAARLLLEESPAGAGERISALLADKDLPAEGRASMLGVLSALGALSADHLTRALADGDPRVRRLALRLVEAQLDEATIRHGVLAAANDADAGVRFQAAVVLGRLPAADDVADALASVLKRDAADPYTRAAVLASDPANAAPLFRKLTDPAFTLPGEDTKALRTAVLAQLGGILAAAGDESGLREAIAYAQQGPLAEHVAWLAGVSRGLSSGRQSSESWQAFWADRRESLLDLAELRSADPDARRHALAILRDLGPGEATDRLVRLAIEAHAPSVRVAAVQAVPRNLETDVLARLLDRVPRETPEVRGAILDVALARQPSVEALLQSVEAGRLRPANIDPQRTRRLLTHREPAVRKLAEKVLGGSSSRREVLAEYAPIVRQGGDALAGRLVFRERCAACHRLEGHGHTVGPDISDTRTKTPDELLQAVLNPNAAVDGNYLGYTLLTQDGRTLTGILESETPAAITLRGQDGGLWTVARDDIDEFESSGQSFMPEGFERTIPPEDMANLIDYLKNWRYLDGQVPGLGPRD